MNQRPSNTDMGHSNNWTNTRRKSEDPERPIHEPDVAKGKTNDR